MRLAQVGGAFYWRHLAVFDHLNLITQRVVIDFIHKGINQKQPSPTSSIQICGVGGIRNTTRIKSRPIIPDGQHNRLLTHVRFDDDSPITKRGF